MISWTSQQDQSELHITRITALVVCASQQIHEYSVNIHALLISFATALETLTAVNTVNILSTWAQLEQFLQARAQPSASLVPAVSQGKSSLRRSRKRQICCFRKDLSLPTGMCSHFLIDS